MLIKENCQARKEKLRHIMDALGADNDDGPIMYDVLRSELMESTWSGIFSSSTNFGLIE